MDRTSRAFALWGRVYTALWGGFKKWILPDRTALYTVLRGPARGLRVYTNPVAGGTRIVLGLYERALMKWLQRVVKPGDVVLDIGSADGHEALISSRLVGSGGRVFAFEPDEQALLALSRNLEANPAVAANIRVMPYMVGSVHDPDGGTVSVDGLIADGTIPIPTIVKMDVEGGECEVLKGMSRLCETHCPAMFVECHIGPAVENEVRDFLVGHGKRVRRGVPSFTEITRRGYNTWLWTVEPRSASTVPR